MSEGADACGGTGHFATLFSTFAVNRSFAEYNKAGHTQQDFDLANSTTFTSHRRKAIQLDLLNLKTNPSMLLKWSKLYWVMASLTQY